MSVELNKTPTDRVCAECDAILKWRGSPTRGQYRHSRANGELYITTHAPAPRPSTDDAPQSGYTPCACRDCMDDTVSSDTAKPELCSECADAGCVAIAPYNDRVQFCTTYECQRDDAYGE